MILITIESNLIILFVTKIQKKIIPTLCHMQNISGYERSILICYATRVQIQMLASMNFLSSN